MASCLLHRVGMRRWLVAFGIAGTLACGRPNPVGPDVYGYRVHKVDVDPVEVERAPRIDYRGNWAHRVNGHWYYPTETGWVVFDEVPPELLRYNDSVGTEQAATDPPSPRGPTVYRPLDVSQPLALPPPRVK